MNIIHSVRLLNIKRIEEKNHPRIGDILTNETLEGKANDIMQTVKT